MKRLIWLFLLLLLFIAHPVQAQSALGPGFYDDNFFMLTYSGTWTFNSANATCPDGDRAFTTTASSYVEFDFWGDGVRWYSTSSTNPAAEVSVCIDSVCINVPIYNATPILLTFDFTDLGYGTHNIRLTQSVGALAVCGVSIFPPAPQPTLAPVEIVVTVVPDAADWVTTWTLEDSEENEQSVAFSYSMTAGDVFSGLVGIAILFLVLIAVMIWLSTGGAEDAK